MPRTSTTPSSSTVTPPLSECFPELLTSSALLETLLRFGVPVEPGTDRDALLGLYYDHLSPKSQRPSRANRRGMKIQLGRVRQEQRRKRKLTTVDSASDERPPVKFTAASSTGNDARMDVVTDPINGRLKPPPGLRNGSGDGLRCSLANSVDSLARVKINEGPSKSRKLEREKCLASASSSASQLPNAGKKTVDVKFWNAFGSLCSHSVTFPVNGEVAPPSATTPATAITTTPASKPDTAPRRILKLNRRSVLPNEVVRTEEEPMESTTVASTATSTIPKSVPSPESGSDMDTSENLNQKSKTQIKKISWP